MEVKAVAPTLQEMQTMLRLCSETDHRGSIVHGRFPNITVESFGRNGDSIHTGQLLLLSPLCALTSRAPGFTTSMNLQALVAAAEARFEHGERPAV